MGLRRYLNLKEFSVNILRQKCYFYDKPGNTQDLRFRRIAFISLNSNITEKGFTLLYDVYVLEIRTVRVLGGFCFFSKHANFIARKVNYFRSFSLSTP